MPFCIDVFNNGARNKKPDIDKIFLSVLNIQDKIDDIASKICPWKESTMINYEDMSVVVNGICY